jgi:hypothetical protein
MKDELRNAMLQLLKEEFGIWKDSEGVINIADKTVMVEKITKSIEPQTVWYSNLSKPEEFPKTKIIPKTNLKQPGKYWITWFNREIYAWDSSHYLGDKTGPNWVEICYPCYFVGTSVEDLIVIPEGSNGPMKMYSTNPDKQAFIAETQNKMNELYKEIQENTAAIGQSVLKITADDTVTHDQIYAINTKQYNNWKQAQEGKNSFWNEMEKKYDLPCNHSWKSYQGLNESSDYCEKCGIKK